MGSFNRVDIDKLNINWDEIYKNKKDAQNNVNNIATNQDLWGDQEGLSAEIYDDGTVLIYEGDTPMGWTTLEALGLDENGNELKIEFGDLSADDIADGEYISCTQNGVEGYAIKSANGNILFLNKDWFATSQNGLALYQNGTEYIMIDTNSNTSQIGLTLQDLQNYAGQNGAIVFDDPKGYMTLVTAGGLTNYGENEQFALGDSTYLMGQNGIIQVSSDGSISVPDSITLPSGTEVDSSLIRGVTDYNGEKVLIVGSAGATGAAMIISADGSSSNASRSEFPEIFKDEIEEPVIEEEKSQPSESSGSSTSSNNTIQVSERLTAKFDNKGTLEKFTDGNTTYTKTDTGYQTIITSESGETYSKRYDNSGNFIDVIDNQGNKVIYKDNLGQIKGRPIDDKYMSFDGIQTIINDCQQAYKN